MEQPSEVLTVASRCVIVQQFTIPFLKTRSTPSRSWFCRPILNPKRKRGEQGVFITFGGPQGDGALRDRRGPEGVVDGTQLTEPRASASGSERRFSAAS